MCEDDLYRALEALRNASDRRAPELRRHWGVVMRAIDHFGRTVGSGVLNDRQEAAAESLVKVERRVATMTAVDSAGARGWLKTLYRNTHRDVVRSRRRRKELFEHDTRVGRDGGPGLFDRMEAPEEQAPDPAKLDPALLRPYEDALFDRVAEHVDARVRRAARANAHRNAEMAYESIVRRVPTEELLERAGGQVRSDTIYQWVRRGREEVLVPVLLAWIAEGREAPEGEEDSELRFARTLLAILRSRERSDAGRPRPSRRKGGEGGSGQGESGGDP